MKKYSLILSSLLFFFFNNAFAQDVVLNGAKTTPINFPAGPCVYNWTNNNISIGLAASGTGNIPSFTAVNTGSSPVTATITGTPVSAVGFGYIVNAGSNNVSVINIATSAVVATIPVGSNPNAVAVDPNYNEVYVVNNSSNTVSVISTLTNTVTTTIAVGPTPWSVTVSQDGSRAYVSDGGDNDVEVINTTTNAIVATIPAGTNPNASAVSPDGNLIYVNNSNSVLVINTSTHAVVATIPIGSAPQAILITPDGSKVYEANYGSNNVYAINTATNTVAAIIPVGSNPGGGSMSPDGSLVYIANESSNSVSVISTATNTVIKTIPVGVNPWGVSVRPDGTQIYVANSGSNSVSVVNASTNAIIATIPVGASPYSFGNFFTAGLNCTELVKFTITVNPTPATLPTITAGTASGTISACAGSASVSPQIQQFTVSGTGLTSNIIATAPAGFELSLSAGSGYGNSLTLNQTGGAVSNTVVYVRSAASLSNGTTTANVLLSSAGATGQTVLVTATVNPVVTPSLAISASANNICAGTPVTFTAVPANGGMSPVYQWLLNGSNAGTNSPTFSSNTLANGDIVICVMKSNSACVIPASATSNSITMKVSALVSPTISIVASQNNICQGTNVTFTATPSNGGSAPNYQWLLNGRNTGTNSPAFASSTLLNGDVISCQLTSNATCITIPGASSNNVTMIVNAQVVPTVNISSSANGICAGALVTFTATPTNGGNSPVYKWLVNGSNAGENSPTFSSSTLANGDLVSCVITSSAACVTPATATSNIISMNVNPLVSPAVSIAASVNNICAGTPVTFAAMPTNGGNSPVYQWLLNGSNAGTNSPTFSENTFANGDVVSCVMTSSSACATPAKITSNNIVLNIFPLPVVNGGGNKTIENGSSVALTATASGSISNISWSPSTGLDNDKILNPHASPASTTLYTITVQTAAGCMAMDSVTVTVLDGISIPNIFTPNGDGKNDVFEIKGLEIYPGSQLIIFNRWGNGVYRADNYLNNWGGSGLAEGTYYYILNLRELTGSITTFKGWVYLKRTK